MTKKDDVENKLIASIKKTRTGKVGTKQAPAKTSPAKKASTKKAKAKKSVTKKVARKTVTASPRKQATKTQKRSQNTGRKQVIVDLFQSGRRVWPD